MPSDNFDLDALPTIQEETANGQPAATTGGPPYTNFSLREKLREKDGKIWGNWNSSFAEACIDLDANKYIEKESVISKEEVGKCSATKKTVVKYIHN